MNSEALRTLVGGDSREGRTVATKSKWGDSERKVREVKPEVKVSEKGKKKIEKISDFMKSYVLPLVAETPHIASKNGLGSQPSRHHLAF